jgi:hypothetical protein
MTSSNNKLPPSASSRPRKRRFIFVILLVLSGTALIGMTFYFNLPHSIAKPVNPYRRDAIGELLSASVTVLIRRVDSIDWQQAEPRMPLYEGDLLRTEKSSEALVHYSNGNTISTPAETIITLRTLVADGTETRGLVTANHKPSSSKPKTDGAGADEVRPSLDLQQIIQFGRSLELIGRVEPGSRLAVNDEMVEVAGDGSFKHFTNPLPAANRSVQLVMKATDLAGRSRTLTVVHEFKRGSERD